MQTPTRGIDKEKYTRTQLHGRPRALFGANIPQPDRAIPARRRKVSRSICIPVFLQ